MPWAKGRPRGKQSPEHHAATRRKAKPPAAQPPEIAVWVPWVIKKHRAWTRRLPAGRGPWNLSVGTINAIAALSAIAGSPDDPDAQRLFNALTALLFRAVPDWTKGESIPKYIEALPKTQEGLLKIAAFVDVAPMLEDLRSARFHFETVIQSVLLIPCASIKPYAQWLANDRTHREKTIRSVFYPSVVNYYKGRLRGLFGSTASDPSYAAQLAAIPTIR